MLADGKGGQQGGRAMGGGLDGRKVLCAATTVLSLNA